jgi:putative ABC transport system ATP-binding protein
MNAAVEVQKQDPPIQAGTAHEWAAQDRVVIRTENLKRVYMLGATQVNALQGVSLHIESGEFVALMGPSGCGKSTLMHLLGCLDVPSGGRYYLEGRDVGALSAKERSLLRGRRLGFIFQNFFLIPTLNALDNVALPLLYQPGAHQREARQQAIAALDMVGLAGRAAHRPNELSGGERQRIAIARALVNQPAILLADEPTGNLDSATGAELMAILLRLWQEGLTILLVTHDANVAAYARRTIVMKDGRIVDEQLRSGMVPQQAARPGEARREEAS